MGLCYPIFMNLLIVDEFVNHWVFRYNKTLLGDKLGKFPAPLLMNTFHFGLQAVLSKIIVCIQSRGSDAVVVMTWKDYFIKGNCIFFGIAFFSGILYIYIFFSPDDHT